MLLQLLKTLFWYNSNSFGNQFIHIVVTHADLYIKCVSKWTVWLGGGISLWTVWTFTIMTFWWESQKDRRVVPSFLWALYSSFFLFLLFFFAHHSFPVNKQTASNTRSMTWCLFQQDRPKPQSAQQQGVKECVYKLACRQSWRVPHRKCVTHHEFIY